MVKKIFTILTLVVFFSACSNNTENNNNEKEVNQDNAVEMKTVTVQNFDVDAADLVDKQVKITGIVDHVCKHGGKKILLVADNTEHGVHVVSDEVFDEKLKGSEVTVIGIVREFVIDEAYCQKLENEESENHVEGEDHDVDVSQRDKQIQHYRDSMASAGVDHLSYYSLEFVSFE